MNRFRAFLALFEWLGAIAVLFAAAQPALYQLRISYRQTDPIFELWVVTLVLIGIAWIGRRILRPRSEADRPGSHHVLQFATITATSTLAIFQLAAIGTIDTSGVHPAFAYLYVALHAAVILTVAWRAAGPSKVDGAVLLLVLGAVNGRLFSADFALLLPLAISVLLHLVADRGITALRFSVFETGMLALVACALIGTLAAPQPDLSYAVWVRFTCVVLIAVAIAIHARQIDHARTFLLTHLATGLTLCVFAAWVGILSLEHATPRAVFNTRFQIFNAHPNLTGPFYAVNATIALGYLFYLARTRLARFAAACAVFTFVGVLVQGGSKAALGSFVIGSLLLIALGKARSARFLASRWTRILLVAAPLLIVAFFLFAPRGMRDRMTSAGIRQTLEYRLDIWSATTHVIRNNPWFGVGIENYAPAAVHLETTTAQDEKREPHPHNLYLAVAQAAGLPGLACFLVAIVGLFIRAARARSSAPDAEDRHLFTVCASAVALILAASLLDVGLGLGTFVPPSLLALAAIMSGLASRRLDSAPSERPAEAPKSALFLCASLATLALVFIVARHGWASREIFAARLAARSGASEIALERYERAQKLDPFNPTIAYALVDLYRTHGNNDADRRVNQGRAITVLEELAARTPDDASLYYRMAQIRRDRREPDEAIASIRTAIERAPDMVTSAPYYVELGILLWAGVKDLEGCFEAFKHAIILDIGAVNAIPWVKKPRGDGYDDQRVVLEGSTDGSGARSSFRLEDIIADIVADYEAEIEKGAPPKVLEWLKVFHMYLNAGDFDEAFAIAERIGRFSNFHLVTIARELADVEMKRGNVDGALEHYQAALAARPNFAIYQGAAAAYRRRGDLALARAHLEASLTLKEDLIAASRAYRETYLRLATVCREMKDDHAARRYLQHALFFTPQPTERLPIQLDLLRLELDLGERDAAIETADEAVDVLIVTGIDLIQQGLDDPVRELARETVRACRSDTTNGQRLILELADPDHQRAASPAFSTFAAWCRLALDDLDGAHDMLKRSREENRINRLADLAAIDLLIAGGRRDSRDAIFAQLGENDSRTRYRSVRESRLKVRFDAALGKPSSELLLEIADHYFVCGEFAEAARHYGQLVSRGANDSRLDVRLARALYFQGDVATAAALFRRAADADPTDVFLARLARGATL